MPRGDLPLNIFEPRYIAMVDAAMATDRLIGMIQPLPGPCAGDPQVYEVGCVGRLTHFNETGDGRYIITLTGVSRFKVLTEARRDAPFRSASVAFVDYAHDLEAAPARTRSIERA